MADFALAQNAHLDCGSFDIVIRQAALHNEEFRAAAATFAVNNKKKSLVSDKKSMTGNFDDDVRLVIEGIIVGWGDRPMLDDDGEVIEANSENLFEIFTSSREGKILFNKIMQAATNEDMFKVTEEDLGNS